ncbi:MAG: glucosylceramidase [Chloroflexi bacterium]|nr:glucosylceramidase [Chloroflexota bacterium]
MDAARYVVAALPELDRKTREYHDTFYQTNLPWWLLDRITSQTAVLRSPTCFWAKDGYFGGWEGCCRHKGCCPGNCAHVWQYAQAHARLFPEIGRRMREESFSYEEADGGIPFRHPSGRKAADGQCGEILGAYREHLCSPDGKWLKKNWPKIRQAMEYVIATWDKDEDGVLAGAQHNTLDTELGGSSSWLGSLYMAALSASEKMAALQGDGAAAARFGKILASGTAKQNASLWNGEYYVQIPDSKPQRDYVNGCAIDQMLGQWWAHQLDLGWLYPPDRVRTAMQSLLKYNFRPDFHGVVQKPRKFVADEDAGLQMICWPKGDRPANHTLYADEVMSGFEYSAAGMMVQAGLLREAFTVVRAAAGRYDGRLRVGLAGDLVVGRQAWGYSGNPFGDDECGKFYARAMSVYSMLLACQGFVYDGPAGVIGFLPVWKPEDHCSFFAAAEGWGLFSQKRDGGRQVERIELRYGRLAVSSLVFAPAGAVANVSVTAGGKSVEAKHHLEGGRLTIRLSRPVTIQAGEEMTVIIE